MIKLLKIKNFFAKKVGYGFRDELGKIIPDPTWPKFTGGNNTTVVATWSVFERPPCEFPKLTAQL